MSELEIKCYIRIGDDIDLSLITYPFIKRFCNLQTNGRFSSFNLGKINEYMGYCFRVGTDPVQSADFNYILSIGKQRGDW